MDSAAALVALVALLLARPALAGDCQPMTSDAERIAYWCRTYPGPNCEAVGRQNLPYISDYANCDDVDTAGRPIEHDHCGDFSPLPPDCVGAKPPPAPAPAPGPGTKPGSSTSNGRGPEGAMPVPAGCAPIQWNKLTVYRNFNCSCANHTGCGYAPVNWGPAGGEGSGPAWAFRPKTGGGHSGFVGTPSVPSSHFCVVKMEVLDKDGRSTGCVTRGGTGPSPTSLRFTGVASGAGGCKLTAGAQYFFAYTLQKRVPSPHTTPGYENYCGMVYEHAYNVDEDF